MMHCTICPVETSRREGFAARRDSASATADVSPPYWRRVLARVRQSAGRISIDVQSIMSALPGLDDSRPTRARYSVPVALGVPPQRVGEFGISLTAPDGALDKIDAAPQVGESGGSRDTVDGG